MSTGMRQQVRVMAGFRAYGDGWSWDDQITFDDCGQREIVGASLEAVSEWLQRRNRWFDRSFKSARISNIAWRDEKGFWHDMRPADHERWAHLSKLEEVYVDSTPLLQRLQARQQALRTLCVDEAAELETI